MRRRGGDRRRWLWAVAAAAVATLVYLGASTARRAAAIARLPPLPDLQHQPAAVRDHLTAADRAVGPGASTDTVGALCLAYHADLFYDQATRCYAVVESLDPRDWQWTHYRALAHAARGDAAAAAAALRLVTRAAPEFSPAWWQLGESAFKAGRLDEARTAWERAVALPEPTRPPTTGEPSRGPVVPIAAHAALGLARLELAEGHPDRARERLEGLTARTPRFGPAFRLLGGAYAALNRPDDTRRAIRQADGLPPLDPYVDPAYERLTRESRSATFLLQQASVAEVANESAWREFLIRRALEWDPDNADALFELASLLRALRRFDEALRLLQDYNRRVPDDYQALAAIGRNLSGLQRYAEAEGVLRRALAGADDGNIRYDLAVVLDRLGRVPEAVAEYEQALLRNPHHRDALNNLGVDLTRLNKVGQAAERFEQLLRFEPEDVDARVNLGLVRAAQGQRAIAEVQFRRALELDPSNARAAAALAAPPH